jgi:cytochrome oxidase assembly protein ShyY1
MYVPRREVLINLILKKNGKDGFEYIVPFVTKEN